MNQCKKIISSGAVASLLVIAPLAASADTLNAHASTGVRINPNGIVRVIGASVTAVSGDVVSAVTTIGSVVMNWAINVSDTTKVSANASATSTSAIKAGDKISFAGVLSSSVGNSLTVAATKLRDLADLSVRHIGAGTISSVNTANGSFVVTNNNRTVTVQTNTSTNITVGGVASNLAALTAGDKVVVAGAANAGGSVITATSVVTRPADQGKDTDKDTEDATTTHNKGIRGGFNFLGGLHFGKED